MSSQNEGEQPEYPADPSQFDAFRARQADDRAQQETQGAYSFPPEYAADPAAVFPPEAGGPLPPVSSGGRWNRERWRGGRTRSVVIFAGVVVLACGVGFGAYEAFGSSGGSPANVSAGTPAPTATATSAAKHSRVVEVRVVIETIGTEGFTGKLLATGAPVTIWVDGSTRFGTTAHPFSRPQLAVGETVVVRGRRTSTDGLTATLIVGDPSTSNGSSGSNA